MPRRKFFVTGSACFLLFLFINKKIFGLYTGHVEVLELLDHRFPHLIPLSKIDGMTAFSSYNKGILHITIKCKMDVYYVILIFGDLCRHLALILHESNLGDPFLFFLLKTGREKGKRKNNEQK